MPRAAPVTSADLAASGHGVVVLPPFRLYATEAVGAPPYREPSRGVAGEGQVEERGWGYRRRLPEGTVLYEAVRKNLATLLAEAGELGRGLPRYVERDFARYLECGVLAHGFARVRCESCKDELLVAFSCKGRGVCPSCNAKRAQVTAAHLVERVLPHVPYRQWTAPGAVGAAEGCGAALRRPARGVRPAATEGTPAGPPRCARRGHVVHSVLRLGLANTRLWSFVTDCAG
ncbi:transposase zinc-binding domain-containing protein [Cystobacter fuscus]|uniref:transposase zinc-binding domain-containing protein n=1 Tax=Cystobacter fuscus TaxID=43 RepID=UPI003F6561D2